MLRLYAPVVVAIVAITGFTLWEAANSDRFTASSMTAEEFGKQFSTVPMVVGKWEGVEMTPEKATLEQAGAVSHVSRRYTNRETKDYVDLWLIVGHSRDISRHTPDICYPSQGFSQVGARIKHTFEPVEEGAPAPEFFTAKFRDESQAGNRSVRVFWSWNGNTEGQDQWEAPEPKTWFDWLPIKSTGPKTYYGNNTALYKMYFTAPIRDADEGVSDSIANDFAEVMIPEIDRALFPERFKNKPRPTAATPAPSLSDPAAGADAATALPMADPVAPPIAAPAENEPAADATAE
ncbi:MAG TPA: exosortase-associated EpsI family protein [Lacipirellulaceae bacterium]|nr:exosortase-associated EpsI family protein [Lacipirellulaceae bacterium]